MRNNKNSIVIIIIFTVITIILILYICFNVFFEKMTNSNYYTISFPDMNKNIYVEAATWGLNGDDKVIIFSSEPLSKNISNYYNKSLGFEFHTDILYFKKVSIDSLYIYVWNHECYDDSLYQKKLPIEVKLVKWKSIKEYDTTTKNYKALGLSEITSKNKN